MSNKNRESDLLEMVTKFYQNVFILSSDEAISQILTEAARVFKADIATWFVVTTNRKHLRLVDIFNAQGERTKRPEIEPYELNWNASSESEVKGITAWIAISGKPLFVPSVDILKKHPSHIGKWDKWLYPEGIRHPESGFLCFYSVPLFLPIETPNLRDKIIGVLKVERRAYRKKIFTEEERKAFDVIANVMGFAYIHSERQKSLTLMDVGHTLIRPLGDIALSLEMVGASLRDDQTVEKEQLEAACKNLRSLSAMLSIAKDGFNEPTAVIEVSLGDVLNPQLETFSLLHGRKISNRSKADLTIQFSKGTLAALFNIVMNLVENAMLYSPRSSAVEIRYRRENGHVILNVENEGTEIELNILKDAQNVQRETDLFKGLPRSYQLAARNGWELQHTSVSGRNRFELKFSESAINERN